MRRTAPAGLTAFVVLLALTACTSATSGSGSGSTPSGATMTIVSQYAGPAPSSRATPTDVPEKRLSIVAGSPQRTYEVTVWDSDDLTDCSTHAYGAPMIRFLGAHPCRGAHRVLATVPVNGRTVALSLISTSFPSTAKDPYATTAAFIKLEQADGTGSLNDLLREGGTLPGAEEIPSTEAFTVLSQDAGVTVFDAWYVDGTTADQDPTLVTLERNLYLTRLQSA